MRQFVRISEEGEKFLRKGQMWMYRNNVGDLDESIESVQGWIHDNLFEPYIEVYVKSQYRINDIYLQYLNCYLLNL